MSNTFGTERLQPFVCVVPG